jgi:hypothetical protein
MTAYCSTELLTHISKRDGSSRNVHVNSIVLLPGFQKGRDIIKVSQGKGQGEVLAKNGQFVSYKEKLEKRTEFHS